jgi:hypothetical protein
MALGHSLGNHELHHFVAVGIPRVMLLSRYINAVMTVNVPTEKLGFLHWRAIAW